MSALRDNYKRGSVGDYLKVKIKPGSDLSFVSAYFTIYAYEQLKTQLESARALKFLFGDPESTKNLDPLKDQQKTFGIENEVITLNNQLDQKAVARDCAEWIKNKVEIRSIREKGFLHGKMYHIQNGNKNEAILGSSNFTVRGLGFSSRPNIELNLEVLYQTDTEDIKAWFDEIWNDDSLVKDVKETVLNYLAQLYTDNSPEFIYYKTLYHIFEKYLSDEEAANILKDDVKLFETSIYKMLFEFQKDGVKGAINKLLKYNGCIIADSVGLGKTFEALAVIKYFELKNQNVLVLCPKKLKENWTIYRINDQLNPFNRDRFRYDVLCHTDLSREGGKSGDINLNTVHWGNYDLVVIDESHNFRNDTKGKRDEDGNIIRKSRYEKMMDEIIKAGVKTKVLMLSATPVNTNLKDLRNQIYFATQGNDDAFGETMGIDSLRDLIADAQRRFTLWADPKNTLTRNVKDLLEQLPSSFFKLMDGLTIARSRKHVERYYKHELEDIGAFPKRCKPISKAPEIDLKGRFMSYDRLNDEIDHYELSLFNPSRFVKEEYKKVYEDKARGSGTIVFTQAKREKLLIGMMKINFMKRLESSVKAFAITMERTIEKIENLEGRIKQFKKFKDANPDIDFDDLNLDFSDDDELRESFEVGKKLVFKLAHLNVDEWLELLKQDKQQLGILLSAAHEVDAKRDAKLDELKKLISAKVKNPTTTKKGTENKKVLLFTAFADTAKYLYEELEEWAHSKLGVHIALVTGSGDNKTTYSPRGFTKQTEYNSILANFSPISKNRSKMSNMPQDGEIDFLIATDCISEGQNLQDCDYMVNYDIHWNPVRIIQRFGRIDRIGSINKEIHLVNFWPTDDLNKYINLKHRVESRMALVDVAATNEDNILSMDNLEDMITEDLKYRDKQLIRLKDEILDLEDFNENISLSEFSLDDFRIELSKYIEANKKLLEDAPYGIYSVVPPSAEYQQVVPGVIFCLRQKGESDQAEKVNPVQPYYLVYIRNDGEVRYSFAQTKQILEVLRHLSLGKTEAYADLCQLFDAETEQGKNMGLYSKLLERSIQTISQSFKVRAGRALASSRAATLIPEQQQPNTAKDFELITWLVIKDKNK